MHTIGVLIIDTKELAPPELYPERSTAHVYKDNAYHIFIKIVVMAEFRLAQCCTQTLHLLKNGNPAYHQNFSDA